MILKNETLLSKTIIFLRFPLIIAVVFIHNNLNETVINGNELIKESNLLIYNILYHVINNDIARIAVPLFFFISGFLFFYRISVFSKNEYKNKIKKRFKSLLIRKLPKLAY